MQQESPNGFQQRSQVAEIQKYHQAINNSVVVENKGQHHNRL
jgi:hypothetical protein